MGGRGSGSNMSSTGRFSPSSFQFRSNDDGGVSRLMNALDRRVGVTDYSNGNVGFGNATLADGDRVSFGYDDNGAYILRQGRRFYNLDEFERSRRRGGRG